MQTTYTWTITSIIGYPQYEGQTDVVTTALYIVTAVDVDGNIASVTSSQTTPLDPSAPFIPYPDLTNEIVVGWVQSSLGESGVESIKINLNAQIESQINPPLTPQILPIPWA